MRVLMTTDTVGGVWTFSKELAGQLLLDGHAVALVSFGRAASAAQQAWCAEMGRLFGDSFLYRESPAPLEWMDENAHAYEDGERVLLEVADRFAPDLLHTSQYCFGRLPRAFPCVVTAHSDVLSWADACRPEGLEESPWLDRYCELVQEGLDGADYLVAPTNSMQEALCTNFIVPCESSVVPNGRTVPHGFASRERDLRAISAGRLWDEAKGLRTLMRMEPPMPVVIAGEESFDGGVAAAHSNVTALGMLDEAALFEAFGRSSIYIAASRYEPFGLAPLEAALCGCAVVARNIPSLREVWGTAAMYFDDAEGLERLLKLVADDAAALRQAQVCAIEHAQRYTTEHMAAGYVEIYRGLLKARPYRACEEYVVHAA